ncbi:MAG TPA: sigma-54 dependent transcriptional regulator [bacterium]|nr:sigma-54 dependent transcriptional regulator [bacterium]
MRILIVDDERNIRESLQRLLSLDGIDSVVAADGCEALAMLRAEPFDAIVTDLRMPVMGGQELLEQARAEGIRCPIFMMSALGEIRDAIKALKSGATDYLIKPFEPEDFIHKLQTAIASRRLEDKVEVDLRTGPAESRLIGDGVAMRSLRHDIEKLAGSDATVLITGESGSGKEVVAREIHALSPRSGEPFVAVNIGGIHESLMESELFGHEKGSFTGAEARKPGLFELAGSGTLFLDEIGEMPVRLQVKMLRVLQERTVRRLGGTRDIPVPARIMAATNRDIEAMVREGGFREDLYYRLNVLRVEVPPLRERRDDIPMLAGHLLARLRARMSKGDIRLSGEAQEALAGYSWPGNVRELENVIERALIYADDNLISAGDLDFPAGYRAAIVVTAPRGAAAAPLVTSLDHLEREAIERALASHGGNRTRAAEALGISRRTMLYRIKRYGLDG